jgi:hypothetical protein
MPIEMTTYDACSKEPENYRQWQRNNISDSLREIAKQEEVPGKAKC